MAQNLFDMWRSTFEIGAAHLRSVTEIAPPQPFLCVKKRPTRKNRFHMTSWRLYLCTKQRNGGHIERSLRHVAMVAKFLDDNKPKTSLKKWIRAVSNFVDLVQFLLICQMLAKLSGVESESTISKFRKRKRKFACCVHLPYSITRTREIRKFHVAVVQRRLRHVQKSVMHVQSCCFANISLLLFCRSRCRLCCFISMLLWSRNFAIMVTDVTLFFPIGEQNKTMKRRLCWCTEKVLSVVNSFLM